MAFSYVRKKSLHNTELPGNIEQTNTYKRLNYVETTHFHIFVLLNYSGVFFIFGSFLHWLSFSETFCCVLQSANNSWKQCEI